MKLETLHRLKLSTASVLRAVIASSWFWEAQPPASDSVRRNRRRFQRAALKAESDPLGFAEKYFGSDWFTTDVSFPERAAHALYGIFDGLARHADNLRDFVTSEKSEREIVRQFRDLFRSLAARPGRPRLDKYHAAAALCVLNGKMLPTHNLCVRFERGYSSMNRDQRRKALGQMRSGVRRALEATKAAHRVVSS